MRVEEILPGRIAQWLPLHIQHLAAGALQDTLGGGGVPLRSGRQARIAVGGPFGQQAEFQRTAHIDLFQKFCLLAEGDRKSTRLNSSHVRISYAVFCLKKKKQKNK